MIAKISKNDLVKDLPKIEYRDMTCESCQKGNLTKISVHSKIVVSTIRLFKLVHLNLFSPRRTISLDQKRYGLFIINDFSRFMWVIFLGHKNDPCKAFQIFCKHVQNQKSFCIISDHGGELKTMILNYFVMKIIFPITSLLLEYLSNIV